MMRDVTILYQGGSGGFLLFYYLLLSGNYETGLDFESVTDLIDKQFPSELLDNPEKWKLFESKPDNLICKQTKQAPRLFLICNPCWNSDVIIENKIVGDNTYKILLYTDMRTQLRMAYDKRAYWFTDISKQRWCNTDNEREYIRDIIKTRSNELDPMIEQVKTTFLPDQSLCLQEFLKTKSIPGFDNPNDDQLKFIDFWVSIQPKKVQRFL
jgi:hypothetical protein